jgi:hypothetical protein
VVNHGLKRGAVGRLRLLVQVVDIHVIGNRNLRDPAFRATKTRPERPRERTSRLAMACRKLLLPQPF